MKFMTGKLLTIATLITLPAFALADEPGDHDTHAYSNVRVEVIALSHEQAERLREARAKHRETVEKINNDHTRTVEDILAGKAREI